MWYSLFPPTNKRRGHKYSLENHRQCDRFPGKPAVKQVIPVVIPIDINIVSGIPVVGPFRRPRVEHLEPESAVLEARVSAYDNRTAPDAEVVLRAKVEIEAILRDIVAAIAAALLPGAMLLLPVSRTALLPRGLSLPPSALEPSPLLLPVAGLLLATLRGRIIRTPPVSIRLIACSC
jgi:hypothetical protein